MALLRPRTHRPARRGGPGRAAGVIVALIATLATGTPAAAAATAPGPGGAFAGSVGDGAVVLTAVMTARSLAEDSADAMGRQRSEGWALPWPGAGVETPFDPPAHEYAPGHRGVELRGPRPALVRAPAAGTIAFAGPVAGRPVLTIDHGDGLVTTLEPVAASVAAGASVRRGDVVGELASGGDTAPGALHFGVRRDGVYIDPMSLVGPVERAVLLPCC